MPSKAPGKAHREGLTLVQMMEMFPTEEAATEWFESVVWPDGRHCGKCGSVNTREVPNAKPMPHWCTDCRSYFSVRTGTPIARSNVPLRKWAIAIYLCLTSLKSVSSMKLHRDIGVSQPTAWFMLHRIRQAWAGDDDDQLGGPVEVDETYFGGKRENMPLRKRKTLTGRGAVGKTAVVGMKDRESGKVRAEVVGRTDGKTLTGFVREHTEPGATVYRVVGVHDGDDGIVEAAPRLIQGVPSRWRSRWRSPARSSQDGLPGRRMMAFRSSANRSVQIRHVSCSFAYAGPRFRQEPAGIGPGAGTWFRNGEYNLDYLKSSS